MNELPSLVAIVLAFGAAFAIASENLLIRKGTDGASAYDGVVVGVLVNVCVLVPLVTVIYYPNYGLTRISWVSFIGAGLVGTWLGRVFQYTSIERVGASRTAPIVASQALFATVFGILFLGESLALPHAVGILLTVCGVAVIAWETSNENPDNLTRRELLISITLPFGAALLFGVEPIFARSGFAEGTPAPVGLAVKTIAATLGFTLYLHWRDLFPDFSAMEPVNLRWFVLAGIANTLFLLGYYVSLELAPVNVVVPIISTNTLFVVILSKLFMPQTLERVTWKLATAACVVVVGVVLIVITG